MLKKLKQQNIPAKESNDDFNLEEMKIRVEELPEETLLKHREKIFPMHFKILEKE